MNRCIHKTPSGKIRNSQIILACVTILLLPNIGFAATAAQSIIRNTATVNYDDAAGSAQTAITATTDVTVSLVEASPTLSAPTDQTVTAGAGAAYSYTITSNANGLDTYTLSENSLVESAGISTGTSTAVINGGSTTMNLGATTIATGITVAAGSNTTIFVPSDNANDGSVNGLIASDIIILGGTEFTIASVDDSNGGSPGISSVTIVFNGSTPTLSVGEVMGERQTFNVVVTPGTMTDATTDQTVNYILSARDDASAAAAVLDTTLTTVTGISLTVTKYVANTSVSVVGGGGSITLDSGGGAGSITYYTSGVVGKSGDTLEYIVEISNGVGAATATDVIVSDPIPMFTSYTANSMRLDSGAGTWATVTDTADDGDGGETDASTVYLYAGSGGNDTTAGVGNGAGGSLAANTTTRVSFRVSIQ